MFDFPTIAANTENPTVITILFTVIFSFLLSSIIGITYDRTTQGVARSNDFIQALIIISISAATVIQAIGDSIGVGLGMLGALSIIRFRTNLKNPRDITFMFSSLVTGIACGVYGFMIALVGTLAFCTVAIVLRFSPFSQQQNLIGLVTIVVANNSEDMVHIKAIFKKYCRAHGVRKYKIFRNEDKAHLLEYEYKIKLNNEMKGWELAKDLKILPDVESVRIDFTDINEEL